MQKWVEMKSKADKKNKSMFLSIKIASDKA